MESWSIPRRIQAITLLLMAGLVLLTLVGLGGLGVSKRQFDAYRAGNQQARLARSG